MKIGPPPRSRSFGRVCRPSPRYFAASSLVRYLFNGVVFIGAILSSNVRDWAGISPARGSSRRHHLIRDDGLALCRQAKDGAPSLWVFARSDLRPGELPARPNTLGNYSIDNRFSDRPRYRAARGGATARCGASTTLARSFQQTRSREQDRRRDRLVGPARRRSLSRQSRAAGRGAFRARRYRRPLVSDGWSCVLQFI
jgi:hypothetical protein